MKINTILDPIDLGAAMSGIATRCADAGECVARREDRLVNRAGRRRATHSGLRRWRAGECVARREEAWSTGSVVGVQCTLDQFKEICYATETTALPGGQVLSLL